MSAAKKETVKKVKPYPITATLELNSLKRDVEIIYVTTLGAVIRVVNGMVFVGEYYQLAFQIPVTRESIVTQVRVLKTYDKVLSPEAKAVERGAELHFQALTPEHKSRIVAFIKAIGQDK